MIRRFLKAERGAVAVEYGLIAVLIVVGCLGGMRASGTSIADMWNGGTSPIKQILGG